jgi:hypothetical protein
VLTHLAAPGAVPGITGGQMFGAVLMPALAFTSWVALISGLRGSDRIKINNRDKAGLWGIITGTLSIAAGGMLADLVQGIGSVPQSVLGQGSAFGNPGLGGIALILTAITFIPKWPRSRVWPAFFGLASAVTYGAAGGVWGIFVNIIRMAASQVTGA